jgi:enolase
MIVQLLAREILDSRGIPTTEVDVRLDDGAFGRAATYSALRALLRRAGKTTAVGDEGGFAPDLETHAQAPDLLVAANTRVSGRERML